MRRGAAFGIDTAPTPPIFLPSSFRSRKRAHLEPQELEELAHHLATRGKEALESVPLEERLATWEEVIRGLLDPESRVRQKLLPHLLRTSGLSPAGLVEGLEVLLGGLHGPPVRELAEQLQVQRPVAQTSFLGANLASNLPGLGAQVVLPTLLLGVPLLLRSSRREPYFVVALLQALAERIPELGDAMAAVTFSPQEEARFRAAWRHAARVLAFGTTESIRALETLLGPRVVGFGPKLSLAILTEPFDPVSVARRLARDVSLFDQRGCLSIQAVYAVAPLPKVQELAEAIAWALQLEALRLPPGPAPQEAWLPVQQLRLTAQALGAWVASLPLTAGTVILDPSLRLRPGPGFRTVRVHAVQRTEALLSMLQPWKGKLQGAALEGSEAWSLQAKLKELGFSRFAPPGRLQHTTATWHNGGLHPLDLFDARRQLSVLSESNP